MLLKGPNSEEITIEDGTIETLTVKDLSEKLPEIKDKQFVFVADGFVLDPAKTLKDYSLNKSTIVNCLVKPETKVDVKESAREKARASLPPNPLEVVKSFRVLLDQLDLPFGEKLKDMVNNEETFATILATVPGLKEDEESVKMLKDPSILKHYVKKDNIGAIKERHPALLCAMSHINTQLTSSIDTLQAMQSLFNNQQEDDTEDDDDFYGTEDDFMDIDSQELNNLTFPPPPELPPGPVTTAAGQPGGGPQSLTADFFSQALDNVLAGRGGSFANPLASTSAASAPVPAPAAAPYVPSAEQVQQLCEMGIQADRATQALTRSQGSLERALDMLFNGDI